MTYIRVRAARTIVATTDYGSAIVPCGTPGLCHGARRLDGKFRLKVEWMWVVAYSDKEPDLGGVTSGWQQDDVDPEDVEYSAA
jgi:hypothetical protein